MDFFERDLSQYYPEGATSATRRLFMSIRHPVLYQALYNELPTSFIERRKQRFALLKQYVPTNVWEYYFDDCKTN